MASRNPNGRRGSTHTIVAGDTVLAYLAGIVDGEGWIGLSRGSDDSWRPIVTVSMADHEIPHLLADVLGGNVMLRKKAGTERRQQACWRVSALRAEVALTALLPWLRIKRDQALLALDFREHQPRGSDVQPYKDQFHALNRGRPQRPA